MSSGCLPNFQFMSKTLKTDDFFQNNELVNKINLGGGFLGIKNRARIGCMSHSGGWASAISRAVIPKLHKSDRLSYVASGFSSQAIT